MKNAKTADKIIVGKILSPHGIKGYLKVEPLSDYPRRFEAGATLWSEVIDAELCVEMVSVQGEILLVLFEGIADRTAAEKFINSYLYINEEDAAELPEGHYYYYQLVGLAVYEQGTGALIGELDEIMPYTANDIYVIKRSGAPDLLLPAVKSVIKNIDIVNHRIEVLIPEGLD